jgi:hypothetical protein
MQLPPSNRNSNGSCGHLRIKEIIQTLEANSRNSSKTSTDSMSTHTDSTIRQRPLSQPCTRTETNAILTNRHFGTTTDDAKIFSSPKNTSTPLNNSHRSDLSIRSITK